MLEMERKLPKQRVAKCSVSHQKGLAGAGLALM